MDTSDTRRWNRRLWRAALAAMIAAALATAFPGWAQDADKTGETSAAPPTANESAPPPSSGAGITADTDAPIQATPEKTPPAPAPGAELAPFGYAFFGRAPSTYAPIADTPVPPSYGLGPGDSLKISFWSRIGQETTVARTVDSSGRVDLPLLGVVTARGMTLAEFEAMVLREYGRHFHQIQGRVTLDHLRSLQVMVAGEAERPGLYTISALSTAFNALYQAGGPTARGSMRQVALIRDNRQIAAIDLYDYLLTGRKAQDYRLESGDTLFIPVVGPVAGIKGWVKRPALYELKGGERLRDLIEMAGGVRATTYLKLVQIERIRNHAERVLADVDVSALLRGEEAHNLELRDGDFVTVGTVLDQRANGVEITGKVARAGLFELKPGMRVKDLVAEAQGLLGEVEMGRAEVFRIEPDQTTRVIAFDLGKALAGDAEANLALQPGDKVAIYSPEQVQRRRKVSIGGRVARPGTYDRLAGMRVSDLLFAAGGLLDDAWPNRANLVRVLPDESKTTIAIDLGKLQGGDESQNPTLADRDALTVYSRGEARWMDRSVSAAGAVQKPDTFEHTQGMRIKDLLFQAGGVVPEAFLDRADLVRVRPDQTNEVIPVDLRALDDPRQNLELCDRDRLRVFRLFEVQWRNRAVSIAGAVQRPGTFERTEGMTLRDLIFEAGNVLPNAAAKAEIGRARGTEDTNVLVVDLDRLLKQNDASANVALQDGDKVLVPEVGNYLFTPETVALGGEVRFPGVYALQGKHERLSHLIQRAGGLTEYAFPEGAVFARRTDSMITPPQADVAGRVQQKAQEHAERQYQLELARASRGEPRERISVLPNAVDAARFAGGDGMGMRRRLGVPGDAPLLGCVARLEPVKGVAVLVQAFARLCARGPSAGSGPAFRSVAGRSRAPSAGGERAHLVIVGDGREKAALRESVTAWGLGRRVVFAGALPRSEIPDLLAALDVFVLPSLHEGLGIALIEAMAAGRPAVASRVDGIPELVRHGATGLLVPPGDPDALAEALGLLLARPVFALELGRAAQAEAGRRLDVASHTSRLEAIYRGLLPQAEDARGRRGSKVHPSPV